MIDTDQIRADYKVSDIVLKYVKLTRDGQEYKGCCPFHKERSPSFTVNDDKQFYHCFGCGAHGDVVDFVQAAQSVSFREACEIITGDKPESPTTLTQRASAAIDYYEGLKPHPAPATALWKPGKRTPTIFNPKRADDEKRRFVVYTPSMVFPYLSATGELFGYVLRVEMEAGGKITPTVRYATMPDGSQGWTHWHFDDPRPLYGLDLLAKAAENAQVFICEGEKAADACRRLLGVTTVTWPGGTNAVDKTDWTPLKGRKVVIWPDADEPGWKAAQEIITALAGTCPEIKIIDSRDHTTKGWDAADAEAEGMTRAQALAWGKERISVWTAPKPPEPSQSDEQLSQMMDGPTGEPEPERPQETSDEIDWQPFKILGYNKGLYFYMPGGGQQIVSLTASNHTKANLLRLAPYDYWETTYSGGKDMGEKHWLMAMNALMQRSTTVGIFRPERIRGRGAWVDEGRAVVHFGPVLYVDGVMTKTTEIESENIYEAEAPLHIKHTAPATTKEAHRLVEVCERLTWENKLSAQLLAGWCVIAPICGALTWRPHIWITGPASAGKSTVMKQIIGQVVGPVALFVEGSSTEAGLRQSLEHDARPVIYDEAESEDRASQIMIQKVISLARISSSGGEVVKGSSEGAAKTFVVRSTFCFSSINTAVHHYADETRISKLVLRKNESPDSRAHYEALCRDISEWFDADYAAKMFARGVANISTLLENVKTFTDAVQTVVGNRRAADQIGPMLAGLYLCHSTKRIGFDAALEWIKERHWSEHAMLESSNDEMKLLTVVMTKRVRVAIEGAMREVTLGELVMHASNKEPIFGLKDKDGTQELGRHGLKYDSETQSIIIANKAPALSDILRDTPWSKDWVRPLRSLPSATPSETHYFSAGLTQKGTRVPIKLIGENK